MSNIIGPTKTGFTVYTKKNCRYCDKLKVILTVLEDEVYDTLEDRNITWIPADDYLARSRDEFLRFIDSHTERIHHTFPMVFYAGKFIGGYTETDNWLLEQAL